MSNTIDHGLPTGWLVATLEEIAEPTPAAITDGPFGSNLKTEHYTDDGPRVIRLQNIGEGEFKRDDAHVSEAHFRRLSKHHVHDGDLVVAMLGERLPRSCLVPVGIAPAMVKADCARVRLDDGIADGKFVNWWLNSTEVQRKVTARLKGVGRPRINLSQLRQIAVRLPPLPEQRRIVAKIEELFSDLDAGVAALERVKANLKRYRAAVLKAAVEGKLTEEWRRQNPPAEPADKLLARILDERRKKWEQGQLRKSAEAGKTPPKGWREKYSEPSPPSNDDRPELPATWAWATIDELTSGDRTSAYGVLQPGDDTPGGVPLIRVCDVADGRVAEDQLKRIAPAISSKYERTVLQGGEVLLTIVGTIGRTAVVPDSLRGANTAGAVAVIPTTSLIPPRYMEMMLRDSTMRARLTQAAHEVARKTLNLEDVRIACIPLAPRDEQDQIVAEVERRLSVVEAVESEVEHGLQRAARLRQAILKRAFEGKLVPQDPADEPAQTLLPDTARAKEPARVGRKMTAPRPRARCKPIAAEEGLFNGR